MAELAVRPMTFEEFVARGNEGRYELVDGRLEELVAPNPRHGWTYFALAGELYAYLRLHRPLDYAASELDIPTAPFSGRRPDIAYYAADVLNSVDLPNCRVTGVPTLAVEVVSPDDERRDLVTKRREYAAAGIPHYWILHPERRTATILVLQDGDYVIENEFSGNQVLTSHLFPGLEIPLARLFR